MNIDQLVARYKATPEEIVAQSSRCERLDFKGREAFVWSQSREEYVASGRLLRFLKQWGEGRT